MKENHLGKLCGSCNPYPSAFYEEELRGKALQELESPILVHFMKQNHLNKLCGSCNPYPSAFYEGEAGAEALRELQSLS